jgi:GNAT superfamily N-acetyltransferase
MKILKATADDLVEVLFLLKECVSDLNSKGLKHWNNAYPGADAMIKAMDSDTLFICKEIGIAKGFVTISEEPPAEYKDIDWQTGSDKVLYIRYLAIHPLWQGKGIAKKLVDYVEKYASENNYSSLRADIYGGIGGANKLCEDLGFNKTGEFHSEFQSTPYLTYEKGL